MSKGVLVGVMFLVLLTGVSAQGVVGDSIWESFLNIFSVAPWLDMDDESKTAAFMRLVLFVVLFAILHNVLIRLGGENRLFKKNASIVIALAFATISVVWMPQDILNLIGQSYATLVAWILVGATVGAILYILYFVIKPGEGQEQEAFYPITRIVGLVLLYWLLSVIDGQILF